MDIHPIAADQVWQAGCQWPIIYAFGRWAIANKNMHIHIVGIRIDEHPQFLEHLLIWHRDRTLSRIHGMMFWIEEARAVCAFDDCKKAQLFGH